VARRCTLKSDIYSFGIVLLEIVTGVMPVTRGKTTTPQVPHDCPEVRRTEDHVSRSNKVH